MAKGLELPRVIRGHTPRKCFEMNMRWDTILRNITVVFYFVFSIVITFKIHVPCHIVSFVCVCVCVCVCVWGGGGGLGIFFVGKLLPLKHPRENPDNNISSVTNMLEDLGWRTLEQRRIDSRLTASLGGSSLLTLTGFCALSCAGHVACTRKVSSRFILACPQSISPFSQEQLLSGTICLLLSLANTDTY